MGIVRQVIASLLALSCLGCQDRTVDRYEGIVNRADRIEVNFKEINKSIILPAAQTERFKDVIIKDIKPELQRVFIGDTWIFLFHGNQRIGSLLVQNGKTPFANFDSDSLSFGFSLTYRMGMWIGEMKNASSR